MTQDENGDAADDSEEGSQSAADKKEEWKKRQAAMKMDFMAVKDLSKLKPPVKPKGKAPPAKGKKPPKKKRKK